MKKLLILSGKGGTGKTTTAAAFASFSGARAIADCDVDAPNLHLALAYGGAAEETDFYGGKKAKIDAERCMGCERCADYCRFGAIRMGRGTAQADPLACEGCGVCELVCPAEAVTLCDDVAGKLALYRGEHTFSTAELKMGRGNSGKLVTEVKFALFGAAKDAELAIIDGSPGIGCPVIASISGMDLVLIVAEPSVSGVSDLRRLVNTAGRMGTKMAVCVNKWDANPGKTAEIEAFCAGSGIPFFGKIPFDPSIARAFNGGDGIAAAEGPAKDALCEIWRKTADWLGVTE